MTTATTSSGKCNEVKASGDSMCHLPAGHDGQHADTTYDVPVTWPASKYCNERVWDSGDMTDCGLPLPCWKHSAVHKERIKDLRYLVDFLAQQPVLTAAATTFTIMFTQVTTDDVVAICDAMGTKPRQSPCASDMWIEKAFGGVELHVVVPKAACGRGVARFELDPRLQPEALKEKVVEAAGALFAEPPEVAAVLTPDAADYARNPRPLTDPTQWSAEAEAAIMKHADDGCFQREPITMDPRVFGEEQRGIWTPGQPKTCDRSTPLITIERCSDSSCGYCYPAAFWSSPAYRAANGAWFRVGEDGGDVRRIEHSGKEVSDGD